MIFLICNSNLNFCYNSSSWLVLYTKPTVNEMKWTGILSYGMWIILDDLQLLLEDDRIWVPNTLGVQNMSLYLKKNSLQKYFELRVFTFGKSLIWLKVEQSPSSHQELNCKKSPYWETASFTRSEKSPYHQKRHHHKSLDSSIYSKGPFDLPKLMFPRSAPSHNLKKFYPGLFPILLLQSTLQFLKPWTYEGRGNACPPNISPWTALYSVSESHAHLPNAL